MQAVGLVDAVLGSMAVPFWFAPTTVYRDGHPHLLLDDGVSRTTRSGCFDSPVVERPTWGMRSAREPWTAPHRSNRARPSGSRRRSCRCSWRPRASSSRLATRAARLTILVPPRVVGPQFTRAELTALREAGSAAGRAFFSSGGVCINSLDGGLPESSLLTAETDGAPRSS